uniref:FMN hydroxy acid dehydrogenase domain-containing protein n=1 Tax=Romanomermis culicivorax TaxID=13658 RepID=A0A915J8F1_ROMCU
MAHRKLVVPPICIDDFEIIAKSKLPKFAYDYYRSGADDEITLDSNVDAYKKLLIRPRFLVDVSNIDTTVSLLNGALKLKSPICVAATASQRLAHMDGELATSRGESNNKKKRKRKETMSEFLAAAKAQTLMIVSTIATYSLESVALAAPSAPLWFQLYVYRDRSKTLDLIRRAEKAGYGAIVVTIDTPLSGKRRNDIRNEFKLPPTMK